MPSPHQAWKMPALRVRRGDVKSDLPSLNRYSGKSNAFAISEKLGLPTDLIADAKGRISKSEGDFEDLIADLEKSQKTIEREQLEINQYKAEIESLKRKAGAEAGAPGFQPRQDSARGKRAGIQYLKRSQGRRR